MADDTVDVLIIGAGASGAALAWSLAETRMRIVCLEQGDWMNPLDYPSTRTSWELERFGAFGFSPNGRGRREDYPINDRGSPIQISNFNAVGGSTILYAAHFPRFHPSDFRVRTLDGVADDWPIDYATLAPFYDVNARMMGVAGLAGDPADPPKQLPLPPVPLGSARRDARARLQPARLALVAVGQRDRHARVRGPRRRASTWARASWAARRARRAAPTSPTGRSRSAAASSCARAAACARSRSTSTAWRTA